MPQPDIEALRATVADLETQLADPAIVQSGQKLKELNQKHAQASQLLELVEQHDKLKSELGEAASLLEGDDEEMKALSELFS